MAQLAVYDRYPWEYTTFPVGGAVILIEDDGLAEALLGLSQEDVAERIFVSRQTISNWETDRTYPDVQSLLLMSDLFGTSIDELVKGDVATMEKAIENIKKAVYGVAMPGVGESKLLRSMAAATKR